MNLPAPAPEATEYISPHTGKRYEIVAVPQSRTDYRIPGDGSTRYQRHYTEYQFFSQGEKVTWAYDLNPDHLSNIFGEIEGVYARWNASPWD